MTIKQLKSRIKRTEEALNKEYRRNIEKVACVGWGSGMRKVRIGPSFRRESELEERLSSYKEQLKKMEEAADEQIKMA